MPKEFCNSIGREADICQTSTSAKCRQERTWRPKRTPPVHDPKLSLAMPRENHSGVSAQDRLVRPSVRPLQTQGGETAGRASPKEVLMPLKDSVPEMRTLMTGLMFGESPRWRDGRFWVSDWVAHEIIAVDLEGKSEVVVREPSIPLCFDFLPDGTPGYHERSAYPAPRTRRVAGDPCRSDRSLRTRLE